MTSNYYPQALVDTGILVAFYKINDQYHQQVIEFFASCRSQLITTVACVTEVMWLLNSDILDITNKFINLKSILIMKTSKLNLCPLPFALTSYSFKL